MCFNNWPLHLGPVSLQHVQRLQEFKPELRVSSDQSSTESAVLSEKSFKVNSVRSLFILSLAKEKNIINGVRKRGWILNGSGNLVEVSM